MNRSPFWEWIVAERRRLARRRGPHQTKRGSNPWGIAGYNDRIRACFRVMLPVVAEGGAPDLLAVRLADALEVRGQDFRRELRLGVRAAITKRRQTPEQLTLRIMMETFDDCPSERQLRRIVVGAIPPNKPTK
jgi:hypothetical protein